MPISSPCISLCVLDAASGLCQGCGRTLDEIGAWTALSEAERLAVMAGLPARVAESRQARVGRSRRPPSKRRSATVAG